MVNRGEVLSQSAEVGVIAGVAGGLGTLRDDFAACAILAMERERVEELPYGMAEVLPLNDAQGDAGKGLGGQVGRWRV